MIFIVKKKIIDSSPFLEIANLLLPKILVNYFELTNHKTKSEELHFYFKEKNEQSKDYAALQLSSKGFYSEAIVQDFPIRGKQVYLHIPRKTWTNEVSKQAVFRNWKLVTQGTRMTNNFDTFLKEISR